MFKQKLKASLIHLSLSILLVILIIGTVLFMLFPKIFIDVTDFKEVAAIIVSVDLILGPLLTFVVFNPEKAKRLIYFDFAVIGAIQLSALVYGAFALYQIHPVYITFNIDRFTIVTARDAEPEKAVIDEYRVSKLTAGKLAFAKMPDDTEKQNELLFSVADGGEDLEKMEEYYVSIENNIADILIKSLDVELLEKTKESKTEVKEFFENHKGKIDKFVFIPLNNDKKEAILVLDKKTVKPVTTINIDPWKLVKNSK